MPRRAVPQTRLACDRCHFQKLRCQRLEGHGNCARCARLNAACVFSPRQRRTPGTANRNNPSSQPTQSVGPDAGAPDDQGFHSVPLDSDVGDRLSMPWAPCASGGALQLSAAAMSPASMMAWPAFQCLGMQPGLINLNEGWDFLDGLSTPRPGSPALGTGHPVPVFTDASDPSTNTPPSTTSTPDSTTPLEDHTPYVRQLADLNVKLYEHFKILPPASAKPTDLIPPTLASAESHLFPIDSTFLLTQSLIEIASHLYPSSSSTFPSPSSSSSPPCPSATTAASSTTGTHHHPPDKATALLLLSCADRVFDIYSLIFTHMRACLAHSHLPQQQPGRGPPRTPDGRALALPQLRIGRFAPPAEAALAGYMFMVLLMAGGLMERLRAVLGAWKRGGAASGGGAVSSGGDDFEEEARAQMEKRAGEVVGEMVRTRRLFMEMSATGPGKGAGDVLTFFMAQGLGRD